MRYKYWSEWMIRDAVNGGDRVLPESFIKDWQKMVNDSITEAKDVVKNKYPKNYRKLVFKVDASVSKGMGLGCNLCIFPKATVSTRAKKGVHVYFSEIGYILNKKLKEYDATFLHLRSLHIRT